MRIFDKILASAAVLAIAVAGMSFSGAKAVSTFGASPVKSGIERVQDKPKDAAAKPAAAKTEAAKPAAKSAAKAAAKPKAKVKEAKAPVKTAEAKGGKAKPGGCGTMKYYDKKTKKCADAMTKKT